MERSGLGLYRGYGKPFATDSEAVGIGMRSREGGGDRMQSPGLEGTNVKRQGVLKRGAGRGVGAFSDRCNEPED